MKIRLKLYLTDKQKSHPILTISRKEKSCTENYMKNTIRKVFNDGRTVNKTAKLLGYHGAPEKREYYILVRQKKCHLLELEDRFI
jgi:hypothetical protein